MIKNIKKSKFNHKKSFELGLVNIHFSPSIVKSKIKIFYLSLLFTLELGMNKEKNLEWKKKGKKLLRKREQKIKIQQNSHKGVITTSREVVAHEMTHMRLHPAKLLRWDCCSRTRACLIKP